MKQYAMLVITYNILLFQKLIFWTSLVKHRLRLVPNVNNYCLLITNTETVCFVWPTPSLLKTFYNSHALTCWAGKNSRQCTFGGRSSASLPPFNNSSASSFILLELSMFMNCFNESAQKNLAALQNNNLELQTMLQFMSAN